MRGLCLSASMMILCWFWMNVNYVVGLVVFLAFFEDCQLTAEIVSTNPSTLQIGGPCFLQVEDCGLTFHALFGSLELGYACTQVTFN